MDFFYSSVFSTMSSKKGQMKNLFHTLGIYVPSTINGEKNWIFVQGNQVQSQGLKSDMHMIINIDPPE